ncbi:MAG: hypothetical protein K2X29_05880, partial [Candidatus Obscuribacterales bacterium]|nr:hypothetical protein [Candidatus Obscuribacterales bacterium]
MKKAGQLVSALVIFVCSLLVVIGGIYFFIHKNDDAHVRLNAELAPLKTCHGIENSTLFIHGNWIKSNALKGYCFYLEPELGCLISVQLAPNGRVTTFRINTLSDEPSLEQKLHVIWFATDFIYGNEACAYGPLRTELVTEMVDSVKLFPVNAIPVMDIQMGLFQAASGELSGVECKTKKSRPWKAGPAVAKLIKEFNKKTSDVKFLVPPTYVSKKFFIPRAKKSDIKELADSEEAI